VTANLPAPVPRCIKHGTPMSLIPPGRQDQIARWCGVWYECTHPFPRCGNTTLFQSVELRAQLAEQAARVAAAKAA
jgi:hypothetical protein